MYLFNVKYIYIYIHQIKRFDGWLDLNCKNLVIENKIYKPLGLLNMYFIKDLEFNHLISIKTDKCISLMRKFETTIKSYINKYNSN